MGQFLIRSYISRRNFPFRISLRGNFPLHIFPEGEIPPPEGEKKALCEFQSDSQNPNT